MKVTMTKTAAGPEGVARVGTVLDVEKEKAEQLIAQMAARPYDQATDAKRPRGWKKAQAKTE